MTRHVGYVVKRFPRASETFIAQEVLELERQGWRVTIFTLWENDVAAQHAWLDDLQADIVHCGDGTLSDSWKWLHRRSAESDADPRFELAVAEAFRYPDRRGRHRFREGITVARAALDAGVEHLHAHFANDPAFVTYLAHLACGLPFSFTAHAKDLYAKALPEEMLRRIVERSAFAVTVTEDNRRHLADVLGGRLSGKILRLHNGVDLSEIDVCERDGRRFGVVTVARLIEKKGVDTLIEALGLLHRKTIPFEATIIGDGPERAALEAQAEAEAIGDRCRFTGWLPHEEVIEQLRLHDVCVLPARVAANGDRDALPTVLLEAMATGMPVVSTPVGGIPEIVEHQRTGLILPAERPVPLAEALAELAARPGVRASMGRAARDRAVQRFDLAANVERLRGWFELSCDGRIGDGERSLRAVEG